MLGDLGHFNTEEVPVVPDVRPTGGCELDYIIKSTSSMITPVPCQSTKIVCDRINLPGRDRHGAGHLTQV